MKSMLFCLASQVRGEFICFPPPLFMGKNNPTLYQFQQSLTEARNRTGYCALVPSLEIPFIFFFFFFLSNQEKRSSEKLISLKYEIIPRKKVREASLSSLSDLSPELGVQGKPKFRWLHREGFPFSTGKP